MASACDGSIKIWDAESLEIIETLFEENYEYSSSLEFSPDS